MKKFILWNVRDEKIHFMECEGRNNSFYKMRELWTELCKIWFDNFAFKKWSHARYVMDSGKKLVENLSKDQIWPKWLCKGRKITLSKVRDKKKLFYKMWRTFWTIFPSLNYEWIGFDTFCLLRSFTGSKIFWDSINILLSTTSLFFFNYHIIPHKSHKTTFKNSSQIIFNPNALINSFHPK